MKLSHGIDLVAKRAAARREIDAHFEQRARALDSTSTLHAAKLALAMTASLEHLRDEAAARGVEPEKLVELMLAAKQANLLALGALERERQAASRALAGLQSEQEILAFVAQIRGAS